VSLNQRDGWIPPGTTGGANGNGRCGPAVPQLRIRLLGGFRVERVAPAGPISGWQRRTAKTLTKLLATYDRHALHREQILDILWPDVEVESALNSFGKTLYAARRALEPELLPRESSAYLRLTDAMVALDTAHVTIDADHFQRLAESALTQNDVAAYESALAAYGGELLPEDRYEDWCEERRDFLAGLYVRLLLGLADLHEQRSAHGAAADCLRAVLQQDPTREDVHRRLMVLYAATGTRDKAVRQFQTCRDVLRAELGLAPEEATVAAFHDVLANRIPRRPELDRDAIDRGHPTSAEHPRDTPFVGREAVLRHLGNQLTRADEGSGGLIVLSGEAGVGKTRLVREFATEALGRGAAVLWGGNGAHVNHLAYGPFAVALEEYAARRPDSERDELALRYPALAHFVPSLGSHTQAPPLAERAGDDHLYLITTIVRLMTDLARTRPVLLVLGDLADLHFASLEVLAYLADLAVQRRWLIVGTYANDRWEVGSGAWRMIETAVRERLCLHIELEPLARANCDELVRAMLAPAEIDDAILAHVYDQSVGNPLFVEELVRGMRERGDLVFNKGSLHLTTSRSACVPARVRAVVAMRVAPMEESVRRVLALAAAADGRQISLSDLRSSAAALEPPVSDAVLLDALDRALETRILEEREDAYTFKHPLVRSVLYEGLPKHRRDQLRAALSSSGR
jgi:DNA-binding SARP family transcriptional activator